MAALPKPPGQRTRKNAAPVSTKLARGVTPGRVPPLPGSARLLKSTRSWWRTVWSSPMAAVYLEADVPALVRLAFLVEEASRGEASVGVLGEIRAMEDRFGLSPLARRRLQWEIDQAGGAAPSVDAGAGSGKEERWLAAVQ